MTDGSDTVDKVLDALKRGVYGAIEVARFVAAASAVTLQKDAEEAFETGTVPEYAELAARTLRWQLSRLRRAAVTLLRPLVEPDIWPDMERKMNAILDDAYEQFIEYAVERMAYLAAGQLMKKDGAT